MIYPILLNKDYFREGQNLAAQYDVESRELKLHTHEFWEISYVHESEGTSCTENKSELISAGEFVLVSPGAAHCIQSPPADKGSWVRVCNLLICSEYMESLASELIEDYGFDEYILPKMIAERDTFCIHLKDQSKIVFNMLSSLAHECKFPSQASETVIKNLAVNVLIYITRIYEEAASKTTTTATNHDVIDDLIKHIKSNYGRDLSLEYLAAYAHFSTSYLSRYFKECTGVKLSDFIMSVRMERAKSLLRASDHTVGDISFFCGYNSISNFHKSFKKYTGMTASEYREMKTK